MPWQQLPTQNSEEPIILTNPRWDIFLAALCWGLRTESFFSSAAGQCFCRHHHQGWDHCFHFLNNVSLNKSSEGSLLINFIEYWETDGEGNVKRRFSRVTDLPITRESAYDLMRAGRARWRIENETFNTLKNQGYNLEHNYGLGKKHLSAVFAHLVMLAFLVDQVQQLCCPLFQAALAKCRSRGSLWEKIRIVFKTFLARSMEDILHCIASGIPKQKMEIPWE